MIILVSILLRKRKMSKNLLPWQQTVLITNGFLFWDLLPRKFPILADPNMEDKTLMIIYMGGNVSAPIENQLFVDPMSTYWKSIILDLMITCGWQCVCSFWRSKFVIRRFYIWVAMYLRLLKINYSLIWWLHIENQ